MKIYLQPAPQDRRVLNPANGQLLPAKGAYVERSTYWLRRLAAGEVVETTPPKPAAKKKEC